MLETCRGEKYFMNKYVEKSISNLQIQVMTYVFELSAGKLSPLDGSTI